jgi:hypothetical protein
LIDGQTGYRCSGIQSEAIKAGDAYA